MKAMSCIKVRTCGKQVALIAHFCHCHVPIMVFEVAGHFHVTRSRIAEGYKILLCVFS